MTTAIGDNQAPAAGAENADLKLNTTPGDGQAPTDTQEKTPVAASWTDGLEPGIKEHPSLKNFKSPADLAKSWVGAQKLIGADKVPLLNDKSTPEERDAFFNKIGRPEKVEGYKFEPFPEGLGNADREARFSNFAHKEGFTNTQANNARKFWAEEMQAEMGQMGEQTAEQQKATETELRKEWGMSFQTKMTTANKVFSSFSEATQAKLTKAFGNDPDIIRDLAKHGSRFSEAGIVGEANKDFFSPQEAEAEIAKMKSNPAYLNGQHPEHKLAVARMTALFKMAHPE
jgi:hypothetical protein